MTSTDTPTDQTRDHKRRFWKAHIERWQESGLRQVAYCKDNGLKPHQFTVSVNLSTANH